MASSVGRACALFSSRNCTLISKFYTAQLPCTLFGKNSCVFGRRYLFSSEVLGLENYKRQKLSMSDRIGNMREKFCNRMGDYVKTSETNTIFTEDLRSMIYIAETDSELNVTLQMTRRFHTQNSTLQFSDFVFGPLAMRLFHVLNKPDIAYEVFMDKNLAGFFDQISTYTVLMDLLYENKQYNRVLEVIDKVNERKLSFKYPMDCVTLALASCFKLNNEAALTKAISLVKEVYGLNNSVSLRSAVYAAMLALTQKKPEVALEMVALVSIRSAPTPVAYINVKALAFTALGRVEDAILTMRTIVEQDLPEHIKYRGEVFEDVLGAVRDVATKQGNKEVLHQLETTEKALRDIGCISKQSLAEYLERPIVRQRRLQDGYKQRDRPPVAGENRMSGGRRQYSRRPGLLDQ